MIYLYSKRIFIFLVFNQLSGDVDNFSERIGLFSKSFADIKKDFTNGLGIRQSLFSIVKTQDIQLLNEFNNAINNGVKYSEAFSNYMLKSPVAVKRQAVEIARLHKQQNLLNSQLAKGVINQYDYDNKIAETNQQIKAITNQTNKLTIAQKASATASKLMNTGLNLITNIGVAFFINSIITGISKLVNKQNELIESAKQSARETTEYIDSLDDLKIRYIDIVDSEASVSEKTQELNKFKQETVETYGFEKDIIDELNLSRKDGIDLLDEEISKIKERNYNLWLGENKGTFEKAKHKLEEENIFVGARIDAPFKIGDIDISKIDSEIQKSFSNIERKTNQGTLFPYTIFEIEGNNLIEKYKILEEIISKFGAKSTLNSDEETLLNALNSKKNEIKKILEDYQEIYDLGYENESLKLYNSYIKTAGEASKLSGKELESWKQGLLETADGNAILEESLNNLIDKIYQFNDTENGVSSNVLSVNTENLSDSVKESLTEYEEKISDFLSEKDKIDSALKEQEENGSISVGTAFELSKSGYQSLIKYDKETKSYKILKTEIDNVVKSRQEETKAKLENAKATAIQGIKDETETWRKNTGRTKEDIVYQDRLKDNKTAIQEITNSYDLYISMLGDSNTATSKFSDTISKLNDKLEEYKESVKSLSGLQSTIKTATEEQETFGRISADTINALHDSGLDGAMSYNAMTGETYFLADAVNELTKAKIENQKVDITQGISEITNNIAKAEEEIKNIGFVDSPTEGKMVEELNQYISKQKEALDVLNLQLQLTTSYNFSFESNTEDAEKIAEEYINSIKEAFNKEKSELDHLLNMDVISQEEYYNSLFDLNEKYFKNKTDLLDEYRQYEEEVYKGLKEIQIKAIQEQIDALKSVNEEKQEEIDLEKAKQALENAKRQKNITVYDSERGWIHETDRNAIDSAQKEYDDLVLNEKIQSLEKLIDSIENGTNTSHKLDESISAIEQVKVLPGTIDIMQLIKGFDTETVNQINGIQSSIESNTAMPSNMARQFESNLNNNYSTEYKTMNVNIDKVVSDNPMQFAKQMESIADKSFDNKFPDAMNKFADDLNRYKMNHSN